MKSLITSALALAGIQFLTSCSSDILFATHTSTGLDISGDIAKIPDHISLGFRRRELAYVGKEVPKSASVLGKLDSQTNWNGGLAIRETFATGPAAASIAKGEAPKQAKTDSLKHIKDYPLVFSSRTRFGFGFSLGGSDDDAVPSLHAGYTRRIATHMVIDPNAETNDHIPSVLADTSVHGSGIQGAYSAPLTEGVAPDARISPGDDTTPTNPQGGIRIRQLFAIGKGATTLIKTKEEAEIVKTNIIQQQSVTPATP